MKPLVLTLPDSLRDRFEEAFIQLRTIPEYQWPEEFKPPRVPGVSISPREYVFHRLLLGSDHTPEEQAFIDRFLQAKSALEGGTGIPAITLENLPPTKGESFAESFGSFLGNGKMNIEEFLPFNTVGQRFHRDGVSGLEDLMRKSVPTLYCKTAGAPLQPTVFATADEIIDKMASQLAGVNDARQQVIDRLSKLRFATRHSPEPQPLLEKNPRYEPGSGAPEYFFATRLDKIFRDDETNVETQDQEVLELLKTSIDTLSRELSATSTASTKDNTLTFFNNPLVQHAGGHLQAVGEQQGREVIAIDSYALLPERNAALPDISHLTGIPPVSTIAAPCAEHSKQMHHAVGAPSTGVIWDDLDGEHPQITGYSR